MRKVVLIFLVFIAGTLSLLGLTFYLSDPQPMVYLIQPEDFDVGEIAVTLNERVDGYSVSREDGTITLKVFLNDGKSGSLQIYLKSPSKTFRCGDPMAHAGGEALLRHVENEMKVEYTNLNYL